LLVTWKATVTTNRDSIGLVGIGLIGTALARRLLAAGFSVVGYDVDPAKRAQLQALGGGAAESLAELAGRCERFVLAVFNTDQVEDVVEGSGGLLDASRSGRKLVLNASTCDPDRVAALAARVQPRIALLETPLSGTSDQVARGEGVCLVGGDPAALDEASDILAAICRRHYFMGPVGNGGKAKLAINLILGLNRAALAEGLVFAERIGLPLEPFLKVARGSAAYSQIMDVKGEKMIAADFSAHGKVVQSLKDFSLIREAADRAGQPLPLATVYAELLQGCVASGEGEWDNSAIIQEIRRLSAAEQSQQQRTRRK
jgi:3-hydroxyisobutyrate dehydrogenase-like beta-hydroxyacid dehydrogenase